MLPLVIVRSGYTVFVFRRFRVLNLTLPTVPANLPPTSEALAGAGAVGGH
jgi:hypothetical protein